MKSVRGGEILHVLKVETTNSTDRSDVGCKRKKTIQELERMELPSTEMTRLGGSVEDMISISTGNVSDLMYLLRRHPRGNVE